MVASNLRRLQNEADWYNELRDQIENAGRLHIHGAVKAMVIDKQLHDALHESTWIHEMELKQVAVIGQLMFTDAWVFFRSDRTGIEPIAQGHSIVVPPDAFK